MSPDCSTDPRLAGAVRRFHTWPVLHQQTVAEHSWNVARILLVIWSEAPRHVVVEALFHDTGEVAIGDVPSYAKWRIPDLKRLMDDAEDHARQAMVLPWGLPGPQRLTYLEARILKLADVTELWETFLQEQAMGNQLAGLGIRYNEERVFQIICEFLSHDDQWVRDVGERAESYMSRRTREWTT